MFRTITILIALIGSMLVNPMYEAKEPNEYNTKNVSKETQEGIASWYDYQLEGNWWSKDHNTAASTFYPRYSTVRVTNKTTGDYVDVFINDYGPENCVDNHVACPQRIIDLSSYAFSNIANLRQGLIEVKTEIIHLPGDK